MPDHVRCPGGGKVCYGTQAEAKAAMRRLRDRSERCQSGRHVFSLRVYECHVCHLWHVGHDAAVERRAGGAS